MRAVRYDDDASNRGRNGRRGEVRCERDGSVQRSDELHAHVELAVDADDGSLAGEGGDLTSEVDAVVLPVVVAAEQRGAHATPFRGERQRECEHPRPERDEYHRSRCVSDRERVPRSNARHELAYDVDGRDHDAGVQRPGPIGVIGSRGRESRDLHGAGKEERERNEVRRFGVAVPQALPFPSQLGDRTHDEREGVHPLQRRRGDVNRAIERIQKLWRISVRSPAAARQTTK